MSGNKVRVRSKKYSYINFKSKVHLNQGPTIKGTRITVEDILGYMVAGMSPDEISEQYRISKQAVVETMRFTYDVLKILGKI